MSITYKKLRENYVIELNRKRKEKKRKQRV